MRQKLHIVANNKSISMSFPLMMESADQFSGHYSFKHPTPTVATQKKSHAAPKKRQAILIIEPIPHKIQKQGATVRCGRFNGKLVIDEHNFYSDDAAMLGIIAFICNVSSVTASTLSSPQPINLKANVNYQRALELLCACDERFFLECFHDGLYICTHSRKQTQEFVEQLEMGQFRLAMEHIPESFRVHTKLARGVYDDSGIPLSKAATAYRARREKIVRELAYAIEGKLAGLPAVFDINFCGITRLPVQAVEEVNTVRVIYNGETELAMHRLIEHYGFDRLPATWAELNGMLDYCKHLWMSSGEKFIPLDLIVDWRKVSRNIDLQLAPWRVPAFDAYVANDMDKLRRIHIAEKTLERLGAEWTEPHSRTNAVARDVVK